jgi:DNA primase (bacterial type)
MVDVEAIKQRIDYDSYFGARLKVIRHRGDERDCLCPFHDDTEPSFNYNAKTGLWKCHACGEGGDILQFHMKFHRCDFKTALQELAGNTTNADFRRHLRVVKPENTNAQSEFEEPCRPLPPELADKPHEALLKREKVVQSLQEVRGWTLDSIKRFHLGYVVFSEDNRRITIPIYDADGNLVNIRYYKPRAKAEETKIFNHQEFRCKKCGHVFTKPVYVMKEKACPKCNAVKPEEIGYGKARLWPIEQLKLDELVIFEGEPDTILACQMGLPGITQTAGAGSFNPRWAELFRGKRVWICYDNDKAGRKGVDRVGKILASVAEVRVITLPVTGDGEDFTDWVLRYGGTAEKFRELMAQAPIYEPPADEAAEAPDIPIEEQINSLPPDIDWEEHQAAWKRLIRSLVKKRPAAREQYIKLIKERFKLSAKVIRDEIKAEELAMKVEPPIPAPLEAPRQTSFVLAQDMVDGVFHYGIWLPTNKGEFVFRLVTSDRKLLEAPEDVQAYQLPKDFARWSVDSATPYNVFEWLHGKAEVDARALFEEIRDFIRRYMWYPDERTYSLLAVWIMQTYVFMVFDQLPYLALVGTKRAGKTRLFELLEMLCFNAKLASSVTDAYLFRSVEIDRVTLLVDEADQLKAPSKDGLNEKLEILRSGYRRSGSVGRIEGDDRARVDFSTYSMKAIANVSGLEDALEDRTISLPVERKPKEVHVAKLVHRKVQRQAQVMRNKLYCFGLQYAGRLAELYETVEVEGVDDREAEIWSGPACIAHLLGDDIVAVVQELARENSARKSLHEGMESVEAQEILAIWMVVNEEPNISEGVRKWYQAERLRDAIIDQLGWDKFSYNRLSTDLVKLRIIEDSPEFKQRFRVTQEVTDKAGRTRVKKRQVAHYWLQRDRVVKAAERFGVDLTQKEQPTQHSFADDDDAPY